MTTRFYDSTEWRDLSSRIRKREGSCLLYRLGDCEGVLHAHHLDPVSSPDSNPFDESRIIVLCARHHPIVESLRHRKKWKKCRRHRHPYREGRLQCEARLNGVSRDQIAA